jgi:uncharacterized membrane protein
MTMREEVVMQVSPASQEPSRIEASVQIHRPPADVFAFYRDFENLPLFLGDVMEVAPLGSTIFRWTIQGPLGVRAAWVIRLTEEQPGALIRYETVGFPGLQTTWEVRFSPGAEPNGAEVHETMTLPLGGFGRAALGMIGKHPREEVTANLHRLKELLETGTITDMSYAVPGKFTSH